MAEKKCTACGKVKALNEFHVRREKYGYRGHRSKCKICSKRVFADYRKNNIEKVIARERKHSTTEGAKRTARKWRDENPDLVREADVRRYKKHSKKGIARARVSYAIRKGTLVRGACEVCHTNDHIEGHHEDYDKPLDVRWLCKKHHTELHRKHKHFQGTS